MYKLCCIVIIEESGHMGKTDGYRSVSFTGSTKRKFPDLEDCEKETLRLKLLDTLGRTLSRYYSEHPDEAEKLPKKPPG
jgi:hypothetical protein